MTIYFEQSCSLIILKLSLQHVKNQEMKSKHLFWIPFLFLGRPAWDNGMKIQPGCHITPITALGKNLFISLCFGFLSVTGKFLWSTALVIWLGRLGFSCGRIRGRGVEAKRVFPDNVLSCSQQTARKVHYHEKQSVPKLSLCPLSFSPGCQIAKVRLP